MKKISKILSIVLVLAMLMGFALVASAEDAAATLSFADAEANRTSLSTAQQVWKANGIVFTNDKASSTSNVADYANPVRLYKGSNVTIEYPNMTKIVITAASNSYAEALVNTPNDANVTATSDASVVTFEFASPVDSFTLTGLSAQSRVKELSVYAGAVEEEPEVTTNYYVAGQEALCGSNWNPGDEANIMTKGEDGLYTKVYENVAAGEYQLKVTIGDWTESWGGDGPDGNFLAVVEATSTVTVIFNPETQTITVDVVPVEVIPEEPTIVDIATALAGEDGAEFTVKGVVTCVDGQNIYVQDATGGICVRMAEYPEDIALGDTIIGTGSKTVYRNMPQLGSGTYEKSEGAELIVKETTIDALTASDLCTYIKLSGLTVTEVYDNNGAYSSPNVTVTDGTNTIQIYKTAVAKNDDGSWAIKVGDKIDVCAAVGCYYETLQLRNTNTDEITVYAEEEPEVTTSYYVAGQEALCGSNWNPGDENNIMTKGDDGLYTKVYENVAAGEYQLKVTVGNWDTSWGGDGPEGNFLAVVEATSTVTVIFDAETNTISVEVVPGETEPDPEQPGETIAIEDGEYVIYAPAYNMALSSTYNGYYNSGVAVTLTDGVLSGYGETEIWTVTNNDDGTISISIGGQKLAMGESFTSMPLDEINDKWVIEDAGNGLIYVKNVAREAYIEWYDRNSYWSGYGTIAEGSEGMFALSFVSTSVEETPGEGEQPENPEVNPGTGDMAIAGLVVAMMAATAGAVVLKKKEF